MLHHYSWMLKAITIWSIKVMKTCFLQYTISQLNIVKFMPDMELMGQATTFLRARLLIGLLSRLGCCISGGTFS